MAEKDNENKRGVLRSFLDVLDAGNNKENAPKADDLYALNERVIDAEEALMTDCNVDAEETAEYIAERRAGNEDDYADNKRRVRNTSIMNSTVTVLSTLPLISKVGSTIGRGIQAARGGAAAVAAQEAANETARSIAGAGVEAIKDGRTLAGVGKIAKAGTFVMKRAAASVDKSFSTFGSNVAKMHGLGSTLAGTAIKTIPVTAPIIAAQIYTHCRTAKLSRELSEAIEVSFDRLDYLSTYGSELGDEAREAYGAWRDGYATQAEELMDLKESGAINEAEYAERYEAMCQSQTDSLAELDETYPDAARKMISEGEAARTAYKAAAIGADLDTLAEYDTHTGHLMENNPEIREAAEDLYAKKSGLDTGSTFTDFLSSMHAAVIHYLPGAAYVEAAIVKGADVMLDFASNKLPGLSSVMNYEERHKGETLTSIAAGICDAAEARYEAQHEADSAADVLEEIYKGANDVSNDGPAPSPV